MKLINPSYEILYFPTDDDFRRLERIGRICYKSEDRISETSYIPFIKMILERGHEAVIEHLSATVLLVVDRGISHEIVRHRLASYCQVSTRYVNYAKKDEIEFVDLHPGDLSAYPENKREAFRYWLDSLRTSEEVYLEMIRAGFKPEEARSVLPNALKTEIVVTANLREWRHIFRLRTAKAAHPQMREVMIPLAADFARRAPFLFEEWQEK